MGSLVAYSTSFSGRTFIKQVVYNAWNSQRFFGCPMYVLTQKLKIVKNTLKQWNKSTFGDVHEAVTSARNKLAEIQSEISTFGMNEDRFQAETRANLEVQNAVHNQYLFWRDKARVKWLKEGDRCSRFFHSYARIRRANSKLMCLKINNSIVSDLDTISNHIVHYYLTLYSSSNFSGDIQELCSLVEPMVTEAENSSLTAIPTVTEITRAVFSMDPESSPGPDGFSGLFYHCCWDIIKDEVIGFVLQFFKTGWIYPNKNSSFIALIPKVEGATSITQFRPIAMANFLR